MNNLPKTPTNNDVWDRLESIRKAIRAENVSYGEIAQLQGLVEYIDLGDVELLEWAGVPEEVTDSQDHLDKWIRTQEQEQL